MSSFFLGKNTKNKKKLQKFELSTNS